MAAETLASWAMARFNIRPKLRVASAISVRGWESVSKTIPEAIRINKKKNGFMGDLRLVRNLFGLTIEPIITKKRPPMQPFMEFFIKNGIFKTGLCLYRVKFREVDQPGKI